MSNTSSHPARRAAQSRLRVRPARQPVGRIDGKCASIPDVDDAAVAGPGRGREG